MCVHVRVSSFASCFSDKHADQKQCGKKKALFGSGVPGQSLSWREIRAGTQGRNLEAGPEADMEDCGLLTCSPWLAQPWVASSIVSWALLINHQPRKCCPDLSVVGVREVSPQLRLPLLR